MSGAWTASDARPPFEPVEGVEGAFVWRPGERPLRVVIDREAPAPASTPEIDAAWETMAAANPRLHDGAFLNAVAIDADHSVIRCTPDRYRRLATAGAEGVRTPAPNPVLTSVIGMIVSPDAQGSAHVLVGRRAESTRLFGGLWELAPAGGLDTDLADDGAFDTRCLLRQVVRELREETGLELRAQIAEVRTVCIVWTPAARSYDIVLLVAPGEGAHELDPAECERSWEYAEVRWLPIEEIPVFAAAEPLTPQLCAVWRTLGWA